MFNKNHQSRNILIVGGNKKAKSLAVSLVNKGYGVTLINKDAKKCEKLAQLDKVRVFWGDGSKRFILEDAMAGDCDIAISLTDNDENNLIICEMCKKVFRIKKTVALLNDPEKMNFFYMMGVDKVVCALNMITNIMEEQAIMDEMTKMIPIEEGKVHIAEVPILKGSKITEKKLWELNLPKEIIVGCIIRNDQSLIPRGDTRILEGDILLVITSDTSMIDRIKELEDYEKE